MALECLGGIPAPGDWGSVVETRKAENRGQPGQVSRHGLKLRVPLELWGLRTTLEAYSPGARLTWLLASVHPQRRSHTEGTPWCL